MELDFVILENGKEYIIINEIVINNIKYLYLVNSMNSKDFVIRKEVGNELIGLKDRKELEIAMSNFIQNNYQKFDKNIINN